MGEGFDRREFVRRVLGYSLLGAGALYGLGGCGRKSAGGNSGTAAQGGPSGGAYAKFRAGSPAADADIVVATGKPPKDLVSTAVEAYGGMGRFVHKGDHVVIHPNLSLHPQETILQ